MEDVLCPAQVLSCPKKAAPGGVLGVGPGDGRHSLLHVRSLHGVIEKIRGGGEGGGLPELVGQAYRVDQEPPGRKEERKKRQSSGDWLSGIAGTWGDQTATTRSADV